MNPTNPDAPQTISPTPNNWQPSPMTQQRRTPPSKPWLLIIIASVLVLAITGIGVWYILANRGPQCLTRTDYQLFFDETLPDDAPFVPTIDFYGFEASFDNDTTAQPDATTIAQINKVGSFAANNRGTSALVHISTVYSDSTDAASRKIIKDRTEKLRDMLTRAGIQQESIVVDIKSYPNDSLDDYEDAAISISMISDEACRPN